MVAVALTNFLIWGNGRKSPLESGGFAHLKWITTSKRLLHVSSLSLMFLFCLWRWIFSDLYPFYHVYFISVRTEKLQSFLWILSFPEVLQPEDQKYDFADSEKKSLESQQLEAHVSFPVTWSMLSLMQIYSHNAQSVINFMLFTYSCHKVKQFLLLS